MDPLENFTGKEKPPCCICGKPSSVWYNGQGSFKRYCAACGEKQAFQDACQGNHVIIAARNGDKVEQVSSFDLNKMN